MRAYMRSTYAEVMLIFPDPGRIGFDQELLKPPGLATRKPQ